LKSSGRPV